MAGSDAMCVPGGNAEGDHLVRSFHDENEMKKQRYHEETKLNGWRKLGELEM